MTEQLIQMVYSSTAVRPYSPQDLARLLEIACRFNRPNGITGMLLYRRGHFLQVLEGNQPAIDTLIGKLQADHHHHQMRILLKAPVEARAFGTWSMSFQDISGLEPEDLPAYSNFLSRGFTPAECTRHPQKALRMLLSFRDACAAQPL